MKSASEQSAVDNFTEALFKYVLIKEASGPHNILVDLKTVGFTQYIL